MLPILPTIAASKQFKLASAGLNSYAPQAYISYFLILTIPLLIIAFFCPCQNLKSLSFGNKLWQIQNLWEVSANVNKYFINVIYSGLLSIFTVYFCLYAYLRSAYVGLPIYAWSIHAYLAKDGFR